MSDPAQSGGKKRYAAIGGAMLLVLSLGGFTTWFFSCPCERTPGGYLLGNSIETPVTDWQFANDVPLCQIQVSRFGIPHSINLNCFAAPDGSLYLSCSSCEGKGWSTEASENGTARIRLDEDVYPVTLTRVTDPSTLDHAWEVRAIKLRGLAGQPTDAPIDPRPDHWWSFQVESR